MRKQAWALALCVLATVSACKKDDAPEKPVSTGTGSEGISVVAPAAIPSTPMPGPQITGYERVNYLMSTPTDAAAAPGPSIRVDTSSPQTFVASLQRIEQVATKEKVDLLRGALIVFQLKMQTQIVMAARGQPVPPSYNDQQLMDLAFRELNGMTADEIIAYARKIAPEYLPKKA